MILKRTVLLAAIVLTLTSCAGRESTDGHEGHGHEEHIVSVTMWEGSFELLAEFHAPVRGERSGFTVYLTRLEDFRPAGDGKVTVVLRDSGRIAASGEAVRADRAGIWTVGVDPPDPGEYELAIAYSGDGSAVFEAGTLKSFASEHEAEHAGAAAFREHSHEDGHGHSHGNENGGVDDHMHAEDGIHVEDEVFEGPGDHAEEHGHDHGDGAETVEFLKEQQWNTEFLVERIGRVRMRSSVSTVAEVVPRLSGYAEVTTPVEGFLKIDHNQDMAVPGRRVEEGDPLLTVCPPLEGSGSWIERKLAYDRALQEFERAGRLHRRDAISQRDYEEIRKNWLVEKSSYETILQHASVEGPDGPDGEVHLVLKAPVGGIVASVSVMPGQSVEAGRKLMTIVDPAVVWLRADMFEKDYYLMGEPRGAELGIPGAGETLRIDESDLRILSRGGIFDRQSMTIPVIFEIDNPGGLLKIGQVVQMDIFTSEEKGAVAVPEKSIIDEDYARYVFVQHGAESFEKRAVRTGTRSGGLVEIVEGLHAGEKIVTRGAYAVKLASARSETGAAHVH